MEHLMTIQEASDMLGLSVETLYKRCQKKNIPHYKLGNRTIRFSKEVLERWLKANQVCGSL
jgi:excisionase family DNA binding protein